MGAGKRLREKLGVDFLCQPVSMALWLIPMKRDCKQKVKCGFHTTFCEMLGIPKNSLLGLQIWITVPWSMLGEGKLRKQLRVVQAEEVSGWDHKGKWLCHWGSMWCMLPTLWAELGQDSRPGTGCTMWCHGIPGFLQGKLERLWRHGTELAVWQ